MKRKFLSTFLVAIVLLCSILLSSCGNDGPFFYALLDVSQKRISYSIDEKYLITLKYGHTSPAGDEYIDAFVGYISCFGFEEDPETPATETEILYEIPSFYSEDNHVERKYFRIGPFNCRTFKYNQEVTLEIPKSHIVADKGFVRIDLSVRLVDDTKNVFPDKFGYTLRVYYEKIDGKIHFTVEALK